MSSRFDQNWHHLYSTAAGGKDLSNKTQIRVISLIGRAWDMHKNAQKVEWKTQSKISCHNTWPLQDKSCPSWWRFLRSFYLQASPIEGQSLQQKEKKMRKRKCALNISKIEKPKDVGHFSQNVDLCPCPSQNVVQRDASGKKGKLACYKCLFDQIKANWARKTVWLPLLIHASSFALWYRGNVIMFYTLIKRGFLTNLAEFVQGPIYIIRSISPRSV